MSIKQIAEMTGLSITTVSHAINGTRRVSEESKAKIAKAVEEINYKPNLAAQMMKTQRSKIVALFVPDTEPGNSTNCYYFDVMNGARTYLEKNGYSLIISTYPEYDGNYDISSNVVLQHRWIDGMMLVPPNDRPETVEKLLTLDLPIVLIDRWVEGCSLPAVYSDNAEISRDAIKLLASSGKKKIAYLGGECVNSTSKDRLKGYCLALEELGMSYDEKIVMTVPRYTVEQGVAATEQLIKEGVDAVFASNSMLALGAVKALKSHDISIPRQVGVIGYDSIGWMEITSPQLTTVVQQAYQMGETASEMLLQLLNNEEIVQPNRILPAYLTMRDSH